MTFLTRAGRAHPPQGGALGWKNKCPFGANTALSATVCILVICLIGCGPSGPERVTVSGSVTFNGQPVQDGQIRFLPTKETGGPMSGAYIYQGKYNANLKGGVPVGTHRVEILAWQPTANAPKEVGVLVGSTRGPQFLPQKFNTKSELRFTIESGSGPMVQDFDLRP